MRGEKHERLHLPSPMCKNVWQKHVWLSVTPASCFVNFIGILGFGVVNRNSTQAVRVYFMVYVYMQNALRGLVWIWNVGKVIGIRILLRHLTRWRKVICSKDELKQLVGGVRGYVRVSKQRAKYIQHCLDPMTDLQQRFLKSFFRPNLCLCCGNKMSKQIQWLVN